MKGLFVLGVLGRLLTAYAGAMLIPLAVSFYLGDGAAKGFFISFAITFAAGSLGAFFGLAKSGDFKVREGYAVVVGSWAVASFFGALPYLFTGTLSNYADAIFEIVSGLTTTGATIITDIEAVPASVILWRSITHWLGGMGIVVLFIAVLPSLGVSAFHLFKSEMSGPTLSKIVPRIRDTAAALWSIYVIFTLAQLIVLMLAGMDALDALNHAFSTLATGGFSTKNLSVGHYDNPFIEWSIIFFMFLSGGSYALYFQAYRRGFAKIYKDTEFRAYFAIVVAASSFIAVNLAVRLGLPAHEAFLDALFQVVSIVTTTGFITADYEQWPAFSKLVMFALMFVGGCAGSTSGGIKVSRYCILIKACWAELRKMVNPRVVTSVRFDGKVVDGSVINSVLQFFFIYMLTFMIASLLVSVSVDVEPFEAISIVAATLGNVGPGFGRIGPAFTFASLPDATKIIASFCMLLGRLELVTVLVFLRPEFWRGQKSW